MRTNTHAVQYTRPLLFFSVFCSWLGTVISSWGSHQKGSGNRRSRTDWRKWCTFLSRSLSFPYDFPLPVTSHPIHLPGSFSFRVFLFFPSFFSFSQIFFLSFTLLFISLVFSHSMFFVFFPLFFSSQIFFLSFAPFFSLLKPILPFFTLFSSFLFYLILLSPSPDNSIPLPRRQGCVPEILLSYVGTATDAESICFHGDGRRNDSET